MKKTIILSILIVVLLSGCSESVSSPAPVTFTHTLPAPTNTESPAPTVTPDPLADAPEGTTGINSAGQWTKTVMENEHNYEYIYNTELGWLREVGKFYIFDWPTFNGIPYKILVTEKAFGERNIYQMSHEDFIMADIPSGGIFNPPPITATFSYKLKEITGKTGPSLLQEMQGEGVSLEIIIPDGMTEGKTEHVKLDTETGLILTIVDKDSLLALGGENVSTWNTFGNVAVYSQVYGVDSAGNMLVRFAIDGSLVDLSDRDLRNILFSFPANMIEHKDQSNHGITVFAQTLTIVSLQSPKDGVPHDLEIERVPLVQP